MIDKATANTHRKVGCSLDIECDCACEGPNSPTGEGFCASNASSKVCKSKILVRMFCVGGCGCCHCSLALLSNSVYSIQLLGQLNLILSKARSLLSKGKLTWEKSR